jgi:hypothetical protein
MPAARPAEIVRAGAEVRGTQSFVHVMAAVWRQPSLTGLEVLWRWLIGVPSLWLLSIYGQRIWLSATGGTADPARLGLTNFNFTDPIAASTRLANAASQLLPPTLHTALWLAPLLLAAWVIVSAFGHTAVLRRMDPTLPPRRATLIILGAVRMAFLAATSALWFWTLAWAGRVTITGPASHAADPSLVLYFTLIIAATLLIFIVWAATSWLLGIAPMLAILRGLGPWQILRAAARLGPLRGKLIEINLVMGIVKIALIVLAMVFSATPLPFQSFTTDGFLHVWWTGVALLYVLFSDYFHVVRTAVSLALCREYDAR